MLYTDVLNHQEDEEEVGGEEKTRRRSAPRVFYARWTLTLTLRFTFLFKHLTNFFDPIAALHKCTRTYTHFCTHTHTHWIDEMLSNRLSFCSTPPITPKDCKLEQKKHKNTHTHTRLRKCAFNVYLYLLFDVIGFLFLNH